MIGFEFETCHYPGTLYLLPSIVIDTIGGKGYAASFDWLQWGLTIKYYTK